MAKRPQVVKVVVIVVMDNGPIFHTVLSDLEKFIMSTENEVREVPNDKPYVERELTGKVTDRFTIVGNRPARDGGWA